jgi:hypothetical protein
MRITMLLVAALGPAMTAGPALAEERLAQTVLLTALASVCSSQTEAPAAVPAPAPSASAQPGRADAGRLEEYLSLHAHAVRGNGVSPWLELPSASK